MLSPQVCSLHLSHTALFALQPAQPKNFAKRKAPRISPAKGAVLTGTKPAVWDKLPTKNKHK